MSKMGNELEKRLDKEKYEMRKAMENASVNMVMLRQTKLDGNQRWYVDNTFDEIEQVLKRIENGGE